MKDKPAKELTWAEASAKGGRNSRKNLTPEKVFKLASKAGKESAKAKRRKKRQQTV